MWLKLAFEHVMSLTFGLPQAPVKYTVRTSTFRNVFPLNIKFIPVATKYTNTYVSMCIYVYMHIFAYHIHKRTMCTYPCAERTHAFIRL